MEEVGTQEGSISSMNQSSGPCNHEDVNPAPPLPAKRQQSRSHVCGGHQMLPLGFQSSQNLSPAIDYADTQRITSQKMDDSAIETDSNYDDIPVTKASHSSTSPYIMDSYLSKFDACLSSCDKRLGFLESELKSGKGSQVAAMKELEQLKGLVDQLFTKVKVYNLEILYWGNPVIGAWLYFSRNIRNS